MRPQQAFKTAGKSSCLSTQGEAALLPSQFAGTLWFETRNVLTSNWNETKYLWNVYYHSSNKTNECTMLTDETLGQTLQNKKWPQTVRTQSAKEEKGLVWANAQEFWFKEKHHDQEKSLACPLASGSFYSLRSCPGFTFLLLWHILKEVVRRHWVRLLIWIWKDALHSIAETCCPNHD